MKGLADSHPLGEGPSRVRLLRDPLPLSNLPQMNSVNSTSAIATQAVADKNTSRANANKHARALAEEEGTGANRGNGEGKENLRSLCFLLFKSGPSSVVELVFDKSISDGVNIYAKRDGDADFVFLARDTASPYVDNRPLLVAGKPELREYKAVYVQSDAEIGLFSDEVVVNCAP